MDFDALFRAGTPLLDVRAPIEFARGAFPASFNLPILDDEEREQVGICYKEQGAQAAEVLGHELVDKQARVASWQTFLKEHPNALLYCFRGGQRSKIATSWLLESGNSIERIPGGYKALRQHLLSVLDDPPPITLISGKTGVGKTELLVRFQNAVDLEGLANHRGSAFGRQRTEQPTQIQFENELAVQLLKQPATIVLEDESRLIGRISLPLQLQEAMKRAPILLLEDSVQNRVERILKEYVVDQLADMNEPNKLELLQDQFLSSLSAIKKRLGGVRYEALHLIMKNAFNHQQKTDDATRHCEWIEHLLTEYYDPMYEYQLEKKLDRITQRVDWSCIPTTPVLDL